MAEGTNVDSLQIEIEASSSEAEKKVNELAAALERLKKSTTGFGNVAERIKEIGNSASSSPAGTRTRQKREAIDRATSQTSETETVQSQTGGGEKVQKLSEALSELKNKIASMDSLWKDAMQPDPELVARWKEFSEDVKDTVQKSVSNVKDTIKNSVQPDPELVARFQEFAQDASKALSSIAQNPKVQYAFATLVQPIAGVITIAEKLFGVIKAGANGASEALKKIASAANWLKEKLEKLPKFVKSFLGALKGIAGAGLFGLKSIGKFVGNQITSPFKKAIGVVNNWKNSIGRIAFYRIVRGAIKMITDSFREGTNNLYQYSRLVGTEFAPAMDKLATSSLYLKNSLGAMAAPLIQAVAPAVDMLADKFVELTNVIGKAFATLTGKSFFSQAVKYPKEYAEAAGDASKALKSFTMGFDELNVIEDSSASGAGAIEDFGSMFKEVEIDQNKFDWAEQIREAIENGDWRIAGETLAKKLNEVVDSWNTEELGKLLVGKINKGLNAAYGFITTFSFEDLGAKIAGQLNGLFDGVDFDLMGRTLAGKWNVIVDLVHGFATQAEWKEWGKNISQSINGWFDKIDWGKAGETITLGLNGIVSFLSEAIGGTNWYKIGEDIGFSLVSAVSNIDWGEIGTLLGNSIIGLGALIIGFFAEIDWMDLVYNITTGIGDAVAHIDWGLVLAALATGLTVIPGAIFEFIIGGLAGISDAIGDAFSALGLDSIAGFFHGISNALTGVGQWIQTKVIDPVVNWFKKLLGIHSPPTVFAEIGGYLIQDLFNGISGAWGIITYFFSGAVKWLKTTLSNAWDNIKESASEKWEDIKSAIATAWDWLKTNAGPVFESIKTSVSQKWSQTKENTAKKWDEIKFNLSNAWSNIKTTANSKFTDISSSISGIWSSLISSALTWGKDICSNIASGISNGIQTVKNAVSSVASSVKDFLGFSEPEIGPLSNFHTYMPDMLDLMAKGIRDNEYQAVNAASDLAKSLSEALTSIKPSDLTFPVHGNAYVQYATRLSEQVDRTSGNYQASYDNTQDLNNAEQNALLREQNELLRAILNKDTSVRIGNKEIKRAYDTATRQSGAAIMAGGVLA